MGGLDAAAPRVAGSRFETMVEVSFVVLLPNRDDFDRAWGWFGHFETGLRAADAQRLAITGNRGANAVHSLDKKMIVASKVPGFSSSMGALPGYGG